MIFDFIKRNKYLFALVILLLPLLFIYIRDSYDWEGDTALMLLQAENIISGKPFYQTFFIYNPNYLILSPPYYPPLTPIIFASVLRFTGYNILALVVLNSVLYFSIGLLIYAILIRYFREWIAVLGVVLLMYNQFVIKMKAEIMSDIPFTFLVLIVFFLLFRSINKISITNWIWAGLLSALAVQTRSMGVVLPFTVVGLYLAVLFFKKLMQSHVKLSSVLSYFLAFFALTSLFAILLPGPSNSISLYGGIFHMFSVELVVENLRLYSTLILDVFASPLKGWGVLSAITRLVFLVVLITGFIISFRKFDFFPIFFIAVYLGVLVIYPYQSAGVRFILPVLPILLIFFVFGFQYFTNILPWPWVKKSIVFLFVGAEVIIGIKGNYFYAKNWQQSDLVSNQTIEAFNKIKEITNGNDVIQCAFPRIVAYYCKRQSFATLKSAPIQIYQSDARHFKANYFLYAAKYSTKEDLAYIRWKKLKPIWKNEEYALFKLK